MKLSEVEIAKDKSNYLRGTIRESLSNDVTGALYHDDTHLIKFHGSYQQTDRDIDSERKAQKLEPLYSFMIRVRVPGGVATPAQWLRMDELAEEFGNNTMKLTTRQAFQLHGIYKKSLKPAIQGFNQVLLDSIAGCGDVNRNVMCNPNPYLSPFHEEVYQMSAKISEHFTPKTSAYWDIWLNGEQLSDKSANELVSPVITQSVEHDDEPIYTKHYLPRKFKIALAVPPYNDVDIFANDIGLIAIEENGNLTGYNVAIGGGFGMTFGMPDTFPRLASVIGFVEKDKVIDVCEKVLTIQRDWGNRENRKFSRLKYTIERMGLDVFVNEMHNRLGFALDLPKPYTFKSNGDSFGWSKNTNGNFNLTLFIEGGRIVDNAEYKLKTALKKVAELNDGDFRLTGNQNLMICNLTVTSKKFAEKILEQYGVLQETFKQTGLRLNSLACVALNTCTLAFAEAERYLPSLIDKIDVIVRELNLEKENIVIRMTGCPNGCSRPYLGEIAFIGRAIGKYNMYLGASHSGERLNKLYKEMLDENAILNELRPILTDYAQNKLDGEHFGDFTIRKDYVKATEHGRDFHK